MNACNYDSNALMDDGSCYFTYASLPPACSDQCDYLVLIMSSVPNNSYWNGVDYTITNNGATITTGTFEPVDNPVYNYDLDYICPLEDGCYSIQFNGTPNFSNNASWTISTSAGEIIASGGDEDNGYFTIGDECATGCADPFACNYNPDANCGNASCDYVPVNICGNPCEQTYACLLYTSPSPRDATLSRMPSSA